MIKVVEDKDIYFFKNKCLILFSGFGELVVYKEYLWRRYDIGAIPDTFKYENFENIVVEALNRYASLFWKPSRKFSYSFPSAGLEEALAHFKTKGFKCAAYNKHRIEFST